MAQIIEILPHGIHGRTHLIEYMAAPTLLIKTMVIDLAGCFILETVTLTECYRKTKP